MSLTDRTIRGNIATPVTSPGIDLSTAFYANPRLPAAYNGSATNALNYIIASMYPDYKGTVATPAALPVSGNTPNDYYFVTNDGDGKSAGYVWVVQDNAGVWSKKYDVDWSYEGILSETTNRSSYMFVSKNGYSERDALGNLITGLYAGQTIYGGDTSGQNLTLSANSGDSVGVHTGYVQFEDPARPTVTDVTDLGASSFKFRSGYFKTSLLVNTLTLAPGSVTDTSGAISFASNSLTTAGAITGSSLHAGTMAIIGGSILDSSGAITFGSTNLTTTGTVTGASGSVFGNLTLSTGSLISASGALTFGASNLSTTGTLSAGNTTVTLLDAGNVRVTGNTISITNANGNLILSANGTGIIDVQSPLTTLGQTVTGTMSILGQFNIDNLRLDGSVLSSTILNGNITFSPNGAGFLETSSTFRPSGAGIDLGTAALPFQNLYLSGSISNGTTSISSPTLQSLRDINTGATTGMTLFYNGSEWLPSIPDTEIVHNSLSGLLTGDAGHTQFAMLAGRAGGQTLQGGTAASEHLVLESTSNVTKGKVKTKDDFVSFTAPTFSGTWSGTDLGKVGMEFRDLNTKGELKGARLENVLATALPSASAQNVGRAVWATDQNKIYVDIGGSWIVAGSGKYLSDTLWDGVQVTQTFTVSSSISDARNAVWNLYDNANDFEQIFCTIKKISATQVQVIVSPALPAGSYRLIGLE